jgi:hypothetical protein
MRPKAPAEAADLQLKNIVFRRLLALADAGSLFTQSQQSDRNYT